MLDFYNELKRFKKVSLPSELKDIVTEERKDFIDMAISIIYKDKNVARDLKAED